MSAKSALVPLCMVIFYLGIIAGALIEDDELGVLDQIGFMLFLTFPHLLAFAAGYEWSDE